MPESQMLDGTPYARIQNLDLGYKVPTKMTGIIPSNAEMLPEALSQSFEGQQRDRYRAATRLT